MENLRGSLLLQVERRFQNTKSKLLVMVLEEDFISCHYLSPNLKNDCLDSSCDCIISFSQRCSFQKNQKKFKFWRMGLKCLVFVYFYNLLNQSNCFKRNLIHKLLNHPMLIQAGFVYKCKNEDKMHLNLKIVLIDEVPYLMDNLWTYRLQTLIHDKLELEESMACLSTLGGAYSSLADSGEEYRYHASVAGTISKHQFKIALRLGDPTTISRCKLFFALSLMQLGEIRRPKQIILNEYEFAKFLIDGCRDIRLEKMCKGCWAKLRYLAKERNKLKK